VTFLTEYNITILLHAFAFVLLVEQDITLIHDAVFFFFLRVCVFCVSTGVVRGQHGTHFTVTHDHKLFSLFGHIRKEFYLVSPLVIPGNVGYPS